jgi:hypothetical protein
MGYRKLRIAWSVVWGGLALLLIVLWVRSYWNYYAIAYIDSQSGAVGVFFYRGSIGLELNYVSAPPPFAQWWDFKSIPFSEDLPVDAGKRIVDGMQLRFYRITHSTGAVFPIPLVAMVAVALAAVPRLYYRFTLRAMLLATTFVAIALGVAVYAARK